MGFVSLGRPCHTSGLAPVLSVGRILKELVFRGGRLGSPVTGSLFFQIVAQVWPFLGQYMEKLLAETVAPAVRGSNTHLQTFTFTRVELGEKVCV